MLTGGLGLSRSGRGCRRRVYGVNGAFSTTRGARDSEGQGQGPTPTVAMQAAAKETQVWCWTVDFSARQVLACSAGNAINDSDRARARQEHAVAAVRNVAE